LILRVKVTVKNKDNKFGGRNIDISFGASSLKTPYRAANQKDFLAASSLPHNITIQNKITEHITSFNGPNYLKFLNQNGSFYNRSKNLSNSIDMMRHSPIMSTVQIPPGQRLSHDDLMLFNMYQRENQLGIISIPPFEYNNIIEFEKTITDFCEVAQSRRQVTMPIIPLSMELNTFRMEFASLKKLHENGLCDVIGFSYANPLKHTQQLLEIYRNRDEDIWYHLFGVPRVPRGRSQRPVAHIHELQNWGIDTFSPEAKDMSGKAVSYLIMKEKTKKPGDLSCQRYDSPTLGVFKEADWIERYGHSLNCKCPLCNGKDLDSYKDVYCHELNGNFNPNLLRNADKIHELITGTTEFGTSKKAIEADDLPAYFKEKEFTKGRVNPP